MKSNFWSKPLTWKRYLKGCGIIYAVCAVIYIAAFGWLFRDGIRDWIRERLSENHDNVYEEDFEEE